MKLLKFLMYIIRWQLSTPILAIVALVLCGYNPWVVAGISNLIGGAIFFNIDKYIFGLNKGWVQEWEIQKSDKPLHCPKCGKFAAWLTRLQFDPRGYDRRDDDNPMFLCKKCSQDKYEATLAQIEDKEKNTNV